MKSGVRLQYRIEPEAQRGAAIENALFDLLAAVRARGSIQHAAKALGASYRHVWGALKQWEALLGAPLVGWTQGQPARLTPFGERLLWAEVRARARLAPQVEALRAELGHVLAAALAGERPALTLWASHDPALALLREQAAGAGLHLVLKDAGSLDALRALAEGRCAAAAFHAPAPAEGAFAQALKALLDPARHRLVGCARRTQGLVVARGNPQAVASIADLARPGLRVVQRPRGSATRLLVEQLLAAAGVDAGCVQPAAIEDHDLAAAAAVAAGDADLAFASTAAAAAFELDFVPLLDEDLCLACAADALETEPLQRLRAVLADPAWARALAALPGYRAQRPGELLPVARVLPRARAPKSRR